MLRNLRSSAPSARGRQPYQGNPSFSDFNSGVWSIEVRSTRRPVS